MKNLNKQVIADCIYANRDLITNDSIDTTSVESLMLLTKQGLIDIATAYELNPVVTTNPFPAILAEQGLSTHVAKDGSVYTTLSLPLESTNGLLFKFTYLDGTVNVSSDIQLFRAYKAGLIAVGDRLEFNFQDADDFFLYNVGAKLYSNNSQLTNPLSPLYNPTKILPGCLNKSVNACLSTVLEKDTIAKTALALSIADNADKYNISIAAMRKRTRDAKLALMDADISKSIASLFK